MERGYYVIRLIDGHKLPIFFKDKDYALEHAEQMYALTKREYFVIDGIKPRLYTNRFKETL